MLAPRSLKCGVLLTKRGTVRNMKIAKRRDFVEVKPIFRISFS